MNMIMMCILVFILLFIILFGLSINKDQNWFMSKEYTNSLKGIMCIIVVLVHIPVEYTNTIQDAIGSFAYICVTLFFMFSAYGLMYNLEYKKKYIKEFPKKRLTTLLIPFFISNFIFEVVHNNKIISINFFKALIGINKISFITILIILYIIFYLVSLIVKTNTRRNLLLILIPFLFSIITYLLKLSIWNVEMMGFSFGIALYLYNEKIHTLLYSKKIFFLVLLFSFVCGILYIKNKYIFFFGEYLLRLVLDALLIYVIFFMTYSFKIYNSINSILGKISYEIYLYHSIVIYLVYKMELSESYQFIYIVLFLSFIIAWILNIFDKYIIKKIIK